MPTQFLFLMLSWDPVKTIRAKDITSYLCYCHNQSMLSSFCHTFLVQESQVHHWIGCRIRRHDNWSQRDEGLTPESAGTNSTILQSILHKHTLAFLLINVIRYIHVSSYINLLPHQHTAAHERANNQIEVWDVHEKTVNSAEKCYNLRIQQMYNSFQQVASLTSISVLLDYKWLIVYY